MATPHLHKLKLKKIAQGCQVGITRIYGLEILEYENHQKTLDGLYCTLQPQSGI